MPENNIDGPDHVIVHEMPGNGFGGIRVQQNLAFYQQGKNEKYYYGKGTIISE